MKLKDQVIVVTGGGRGIGAELCRRFARESPRGVVVADIDYPQAQGVDTDMIAGDDPTSQMLRQGALEPALVADVVVEAIERETFLVLPHPEVHQYFLRKATDYDRWLGGMRRLRAQVLGER